MTLLRTPSPARGLLWILLSATLPARAWGEGWPETSPDGWTGRGAGGGIGLVGLALWWLCVLGWTATVDWLGRDSRKRAFRPAFWATVATLPFLGTALLAWWIPSLLAGLFLMLLAWMAPVIAYAINGNKGRPESEQVLTGGHFRRLLAGLLAPLGIRIAVAELAAPLPTVQLEASGGRDDAENTARKKRAAETPGFERTRKLILDAVVARATTVAVGPDPQGMAVRHEVDGVWEKPRICQPAKKRSEKERWGDAPQPTEDEARAVIDTLAALAGLDPAARTAKPGTFSVMVDGKPRACRLLMRRSETGRQAVVQIEKPGELFKQLSDLGMPADVAGRLTELLAVEKGMIIISSPSGGGLTTTFDVVLQTADRLLRDFISIEDAANPAREIQNVKPVRFDARTGVTPVDAVATALREYPRVLVTRDLTDKPLAAELARLADDNQLVIVSMKAADALDAVARLLALGVPRDVLARTLVGSLSQQLVRRLCPRCREQYPTPGEILARHKKTPEQLPHLNKPSPEGCRVCNGTSYLGRTALFELASGTHLRQAIAARADQQIMRQAAAKDGMQRMREAGMALVLEGVTSMEEMQRVFAAAARPQPPGVKRP
jgi:type II secretory ATPase GspE/PulE/Tfp pilus assembly ATPase PilB-like protein